MPRPKRPRRISFFPGVTYFRPQGSGLNTLKEVNLTLDELEAIRLADLKDFDQVKACRKMKVSQSTFQRILKQARGKIAQALVNGRALRMKGGEVVMPRFGRGFGVGRGRGGGRGRMGGPLSAGPGGDCVCTNPDCQHEASHQVGAPCYQIKCPKCGSPMVRK